MLSGCDKKPDQQIGFVGKNPGLSDQIEQFTGARTKIVWSQHQNEEDSDTFLRGSQHALMGIDTADGQGIRAILDRKGNYARPLISPDGQSIVFSKKIFDREGNWKRNWRPEIYLTDWQGTEPRMLTYGYAVDVVQAPDGKTWVYAVRDIPDTDKSLFSAKRLVRFLLDAPNMDEVLWEGAISPENFQLSADTKRAASLFPWPAMGYIDFPSNEWIRLSGGCWASISPDNSYLTWVLDGAHKNIRLFSEQNMEGWTIPISLAPGIEGNQIYHPRWSNHPEFMVFTGPYLRMPDGGNPITRSGPTAEVFIGHFSDRFTQLRSVVQVTNNTVGDFYPDLWIEGGEKVDLAGASFGPEMAPSAETGKAPWPPHPEGLTFLWTKSASQNRIADPDGASRSSRVEARERARPWRDGAMDCRGGFFESDLVSAEASNSLFRTGGDFTIEALVDPDQLTTGYLLHGGPLTISHEQQKLTVSDEATAIEGFVPPGRFHLAVRRKSGQLELFIDGARATTTTVEPLEPPTGELRFGSGGWEGFLRGIAISSRVFDDDEIAGHAAYWKQAEDVNAPIEQLTARASLVSATPLPSLASLEDEPYARALVAHTWKIDEVLDGDPRYKGEEILVLHWAVLDRKAVEVPGHNPGDEAILELELAEDHPELASERLFDASSNFDLEVFYDTQTPKAAPSPAP